MPDVVEFRMLWVQRLVENTADGCFWRSVSSCRTRWWVVEGCGNFLGSVRAVIWAFRGIEVCVMADLRFEGRDYFWAASVGLAGFGSGLGELFGGLDSTVMGTSLASGSGSTSGVG